MKTTKSRISARGRERKARQKIGRKILASVLCAFLSVGNSTNLMVAATEPEAETIDGGENTVEAQSDEMCVHGMPNGEHCVPCVQEGVREIIEVLTEQKIPANPLQTVYEDIEKVYDIYVTLDDEELSQLTEDEYDWLETLLVKEQELIDLLDELDRQVAEQGIANSDTLSVLYQMVAESYGVFMQNKEAQQEEQVQNPEEDVPPANQDIVQDESARKQDTSVLAEGDTEQNTETTPNETGDEEQAGTEQIDITTALIKTEGKADQDIINTQNSFSVDFAKQFTLHIEVKSTLNMPNKKVEITVPDGLTVVEFPQPQRGDMAESVIPESADQLQGTTQYGDYRPQNGTITYSLKNTATENSFNIILAPDTVLWNRKKSQTLKEHLKIRTYSGDVNETASQKEYKVISAKTIITGKYNDEANDDRAIQTGPRLSSIGVKNGVPTQPDIPFALRQVWINPDKDYIDMPQFFKELEITIALPYFTKGGQNVYAQLDHISYDPAGMSTRPNQLDPDNHKDENGEYKNRFNFERTINANHTITLKWANLYLEYGQEYFTPYFKWENGKGPENNTGITWGNSDIKNTGNGSPDCYLGGEPNSGVSAVGGKITWADDSPWYPWNNKLASMTFKAYSDEQINLSTTTPEKIYNAYDSDPNIIYYLGQFQVVNNGGTKSASKTLEFTYNSDSIGVVAQKIPASTGNEVSNIRYKTNKNTNWQTYGSKLISSGGFVTFTDEMANLSEREYFTAIKADVGRYERDYVSYVASRSSDPTSGYGATFGKLLYNTSSTYTNFASMEMYDTDSSSSNSTSKGISYTVTMTLDAGEIPPGMEQAYKPGEVLERMPILSQTSVTAGDTVTFNGLLSSSAYPYSTNNIMTDPEIYIRLPEKIDVNNLQLYQEIGRQADKVFLGDMVTETEKPKRVVIDSDSYKFEPISEATTAEEANKTNYKLYKITFTDTSNPAKVGWFSDNLGQYQIGISFDMEIAKDADAMTLDMRDCVRFKSKTLEHTSNNGTLSQYQVFDTYDMNRNGKIDERFSTFNVNAKGTKLSVVAARLGLTFTFGARVADKGSAPEFDPTQYSNFETDNEKVYLKDENHVIDMLFTLKNETGREFTKEDAQAFYYFIPVPKKGDLWDSHMQDQAFEFDMNLTREPSLEGVSKDNIQVTYATDIDSHVNSGDPKHYSNKNNYKTQEDLLNDCTTDEAKAAQWKKVKMIRIAAKESVGQISKNAYLAVNLRLEPTFTKDQDHFDEMRDLVGSIINFGPCGVSPYSVGATQNQGHNPLPRIQVEFQTGVISGKVYMDKNCNGLLDEDEEVYTGDSITVSAQHQNFTAIDQDEEQEVVTKDGTFKFSKRRADTYHVIVTNPGSTDAFSSNPLRFSLPTNGKFSLSEDGKTATATMVLDMNQSPNDNNIELEIGLQRPHNVLFSASNASLSQNSTKVWHNDELTTVPLVAVKEGYRFTGWKIEGEDKLYSTEDLKNRSVTEDIKITAEVKKLHTLVYNGNGNTQGNPPLPTQHIEDEKVKPDYTGTQELKKGENTIFVGWSTTQIKDVLSENATLEDINSIISNDEHLMPDHNVTLYAVYAYDNNKNGEPDYNDDAVHVRYHGNNNKKGNGENGDIICPHHHVVGEVAKLSENGTVSGKTLDHKAPASSASEDIKEHTFTYDPNIFIGWSTTAMPDVIKTNEQYKELQNSILTEVKMLDKEPTETTESDDTQYADDDGNTNVYAVWAADRNGNRVADYLEERTLTYEGNAIEGNVLDLPSVVTKLDDQESLLSEDVVKLSTKIPTHSAVKKNDKEINVIFIGWTLKQTTAIFSREDAVPETINQVTIGDSDATVYAAWGYDEDGDNTADVLETYTLSYNLNGGNGETPSKAEGLKKGDSVKISNQTNFTRNEKELFMGWSMKQHENAFTADQGNLINEILITGNEIRMGTKDITLYAVWARDSNGNGTADYLELIKVLYKGNAIEGEASNVPLGSAHIPGSTASLNTSTKPSHTNVDNQRVVFIGWSLTQNNQIYDLNDNVPETITEIKIEADEKQDKTVYAVWGYDSDNDPNHPGYGVADVLERYSLSYDLNGGKETAPMKEEGLKKGESVTISNQTNFTRNDQEIFVGWSTKKIENALTDEPAENLLIKNSISISNNTVLYAVWAKNVNNNDEPDYAENIYSVTYYANNGTEKNASCTHKHVAGEKCTLLDKKEVNNSLHFKKEGAVWIGWSKTKSDKNITSAAEAKAAEIITEPFEINNDINANTVYAVWAEDKNNNGTADLVEDKRSVLYHSNNEKDMVIHCGHHHVAGETVKLFAPDQLVGSEEGVSASAPHTFTRDKAVLIGWSENKVDKLVTNENEKTNANIVSEVKITEKDHDVYAVWAEDKNGNGTPDYDESRLKLSYELNGGEGTAPESSSYLPGETVTLPSDQPTHNDLNGVKVLFVGWSLKQVNVLSAGDSVPSLIRAPYTMPKTDTTLYAVWSKDVNGNGIADYLEKTFTLTYDLNGGTANEFSDSSPNHVAGEEVVLNKAPVPTHKQENGTLVVFLGWTEEKPDKIYSATDAMPVLLSSVRFGSKDITVYAAWGYDMDTDGKADILKTYEVKYDLNGGSGTVPTETNHKAGETFPIRHSTNLSKEGAIFAGWSTTKIEKVLDAYASDGDIGKIISSDDYTMPAANVTFYAVWAKDANGNGKPDYADSSVQIVYHANNGSDNKESCKHHHVAGEQVDLSKTTSFAKEKAVFVGWSLKPLKEIKTMSQYKDIKSELVASIEMKKSGNNVYAVWATASDGKNEDYLKEYLVSYDGNGNTSITVPDSHNYHEGELVTIAYPSNLPKEGVIFAGWSTTKIDQVLDAKADPELIKQIITSYDYTMPAHPVTFNAVWAVDSDGNGKPDFAEDAVHVQYHDGENVVTCAHNHMVGTKAELVASASHMYGRLNDEKDNKNHSFKKEKAVFVGWSLEPVKGPVNSSSAYEAVTSITMKAKGNDVYAVWAEDQNENGVADYTEHVEVIYDGNAQAGDTVSNVPSDSGIHLPGDTVPLSGKPEYKAKDKKTVVFLGWTKEKHAILTRTDKMPSRITELTLKDMKETVYALWGYDEDKQNGADVLETYTLSYDLNGSKDSAPASKDKIAKSSNVTVASEKDFTRNAKEVFAGWSRKQYISAVRSIDLNEIIVPGSIHVMPAENVTLYAVWAQDNNHNDVADYMEKAFTLRYEGNAQSGGTVSNCPSESRNHILSEKVTLNDQVPTHSDADGIPVRFIGWTLERTDHIYEREEAAPATVPSVTFGSEDKTVYAAWGYDADRNGKADVLKDYTLTYDLNGGNGIVPAKNSYKAGARVHIVHPEDLAKGKAVFAGWSTEPIEQILKVDPDIAMLRKILATDEYTMPAANVTLYAVWAEDLDGNTLPDYAENAVHIQYHSNNEKDEQTVLCPHHHIIHTKAVLSSNAQYLYGRTAQDNEIKNHSFKKDKAVFIGWSKEKLDDIRTQTQYAQISGFLLGSEITLEENNDVYAVWAVDENENGVADYREGVQLSYDANAQSGTVSSMPKNVENGIPGDKITLTGSPEHDPVDGKAVLFLGWAEEPMPICGREDEDPTPELVSEVVLGTVDRKVYAVWGYDEDGKNGADVLETYTLSYDLNGGKGKAPSALTDIVKGTLVPVSKEHDFIRNEGEIFAGWSRTHQEEAFSVTDGNRYHALRLADETLKMPASDTTLYALWADDDNRNGIADFDEMVQLRYDSNVQENDRAHNMPAKSIHLPGNTVTLSQNVPTYSAADGKSVLFLGWTDEPMPILAREDADPSEHLVKEVTLGAENRKVYAAWGYDEDGRNGADVLETYTISYDLNGGTGKAPAALKDIAKGTLITIPSDQSFTRGEDEVFAGWSLEKHEQAFTPEQNEALENACLKDPVKMGAKDLTLYAVWKKGNTMKEPDVTVTYDLNGGKWKDAGLPDTFTASKGTVHTIQAKPVRAGFEFTGWKDSQGHMYDPGDTLKLADSVTLTAQWQAVSQRSASSSTPRSDRSSHTARSARTAQATHQAFWLSLAAGSLAAAEVLRKKRKKK